MKNLAPFYLSLLSAVLFFGCASPRYADQGALTGGLAGAGIGAAIGEASGEPAAGALIGGALGAVTGQAVGENIDRDIAFNRAHVAASAEARRALAVADVVSMTHNGVGDDLICTHIRSSGVIARPTSQETIQMKQAGVSDMVIKAMYEAPLPYAGPPPVIVEEHVYGPPPVIVRPHFHRHPHHYHRHPRYGRPGVHWGFSFSR